MLEGTEWLTLEEAECSLEHSTGPGGEAVVATNVEFLNWPCNLFLTKREEP